MCYTFKAPIFVVGAFAFFIDGGVICDIIKL